MSIQLKQQTQFSTGHIASITPQELTDKINKFVGEMTVKFGDDFKDNNGSDAINGFVASSILFMTNAISSLLATDKLNGGDLTQLQVFARVMGMLEENLKIAGQIKPNDETLN